MTQLKSLIKEVERLNDIKNREKDTHKYIEIGIKLESIKQTVEVADDLMKYNNYECLSTKEKAEWFKLKELLGIK